MMSDPQPPSVVLEKVKTKIVQADEAGLRLDRWFLKHFPEVPFRLLQKLLRSGQIRLNGKRVKTVARVAEGDEVRVPPLRPKPALEASEKPLTPHEIKDVKSWVLYEDEHILVLNKPAGIATQGGTKTYQHMDRLAAAFDPRPRLVHRLDKETSGVLVFAKSRLVAKELMHLLQQKNVEKIYWAITWGVPHPLEGVVNQPLHKKTVGGEDLVVVDAEEGKRALTEYRVMDHAGKQAAWVEARPLTGRTHQIRAHLAYLGTPIVGDGKYDRQYQEEQKNNRNRGLPMALHARHISFNLYGKDYEVTAPLPRPLLQLWQKYGFDEKSA